MNWERWRRSRERTKGEEEEEAGGRDKKLGRVPGSIPPLLSRPFWAATFSHLSNVINEKAFRRDGGLDSGFRLWPTPADAAKPSGILFKLIGCHFQVQGTRQGFVFSDFCYSCSLMSTGSGNPAAVLMKSDAKTRLPFTPPSDADYQEVLTSQAQNVLIIK